MIHTETINGVIAFSDNTRSLQNTKDMGWCFKEGAYECVYCHGQAKDVIETARSCPCRE